LEDERAPASDDDDEDYTSADASESTMKYKYSNAAANAAGSGSKSRIVPGVEESMASSSVMMSSAGKDQSSLRGRLTQGAGKTHINVGSIHHSTGKEARVAASSNLDETEEEDSESLSISVSQPDNKYSSAWNKLREKYLGGGMKNDDDDDDDSDDDDDDYESSTNK